jgi:hypothetical protein
MGAGSAFRRIVSTHAGGDNVRNYFRLVALVGLLAVVSCDGFRDPVGIDSLAPGGGFAVNCGNQVSYHQVNGSCDETITGKAGFQVFDEVDSERVQVDGAGNNSFSLYLQNRAYEESNVDNEGVAGAEGADSDRTWIRVDRNGVVHEALTTVGPASDGALITEGDILVKR